VPSAARELFLTSLRNFQPGGMKLSLFIVLFGSKWVWNGTQGKHTPVSKQANKNGLENTTSGAKLRILRCLACKAF